jgi:16S rRNA (adenine1518-N6/adenine1519-N6)-dimethyltransferase
VARGRPIKGRLPLLSKKRLGQHFLIQPDVIAKIIRLAGFQDSDRVLEIGPGTGALTLQLAPAVAHLFAVEKDPRLVDLLREKLQAKQIQNVTLITDDILKWDFGAMGSPSAHRLQVIGNLPYNISSPILEKLMDNRELLARAVLMFQLEVAKRLTASPGGKDYGAMTLLTQYHARPTPLLEVSRHAFYPRPKVDSMVVTLNFQEPYPRRASSDAHFRRAVRGAFAHRRKTLLNSLKRAYPAPDPHALLEALSQCKIDPLRRAETLEMEEFICLSDALALTNGPTGGK